MASYAQSWLGLVRVIHQVEAELARVMQSAHGLGLSEYRALAALAKAPDSELRMQDLATHLQLNQSSVSRMVERLERAELSVRDVCPDDKRGVYTVLTQKGRACLAAAEVDYEKTLEAAMKAHGCQAWLSVAMAHAQ
ncbi:MarR family winged helix-turn-helix transcriptional regulator [Woodsholea maritima]|uniref:MarR family winged helix-turn-helix transcriptional regulator n=1 Tax=Woodsholea maritima TaxID=240237 RepID=UPI0003824F1D|nr:MarR family transcriptional regulator [Woodsholea maritima]